MFGTVAALFAIPMTCNSLKDLTQDPIKELIREHLSNPHFTILLYDMESKGIFSKDYRQRYRTIYDSSGVVVARTSRWYDVPSAHYQQHENNIGMEVAAKSYKDQEVRRIVGPPGYTNFIGNPKYGYWSDGTIKSVVYNEVIDETLVPGAAALPRIETSIDASTTGTAVTYRRIDRNALPNLSDTAYIKIEPTYPENLDPLPQDYWRFYPSYLYLKTLLQLPSGKVKNKEHQEARRYYSGGYAYYGIFLSTGTRRYGTYSSTSRLYSRGRAYSRGGGGFGK